MQSLEEAAGAPATQAAAATEPVPDAATDAERHAVHVREGLDLEMGAVKDGVLRWAPSSRSRFWLRMTRSCVADAALARK